jgi:4-hydroxy-3-polyprenylbenzoate decarboxylase
MNHKPYVVAMTGASGAIYGVRLVRALAEIGREIALVISESARTVIREELAIDVGDLRSPHLESLFDSSAPAFLSPEGKGLGEGSARGVLDRITYYFHGDFTAPIASGSFPTEGMLIVPCSTTTLGRIAAGISQTLVERAAECTIKEGRTLVLVPRETPLSAIHLENMLKLARLGVRIVPAMPGFYAGAKAIEEMVDFVAGKALDQLSVPHALYRRWVGGSVQP